MIFLTPMQLFVWIIGLVIAAALIITFFVESIIKAWFNYKKQYIAENASAFAKTLEAFSKKLQEKADMKKKERAASEANIDKVLDKIFQDIDKNKNGHMEE